MVAEIGDWGAFRSGRSLAAWIGLVPQQHSTGGKERLGSIIKRGNRYLRSSVTQAEIIERHGKADFIATTLGHVTTPVHGKGVVPPGGWYSTTKDPYTYIIHPKFAEACKKKRRL
jgi:transposase IS116/IS110/IS902 family protein